MLTRMEGDIISGNKENTSATNLINLGESGNLKRNSCMGNESTNLKLPKICRPTTSHSSLTSSQLILEIGSSSSESAAVAATSACSMDYCGDRLTSSLSSSPAHQPSSNADLIASKQKLLQKENLRRVMNPPKLERKHSSGDLHSRLKTRKILGVGETDNGDIHRSKISQVLGHNEHLYVKFPKGVWNWQAFLSAMLFVQALLILFFPRQASQLKLLGIQRQQTQQQDNEEESWMTASKYYAVALLALSVTFWRFMYIRDKTVVRTVQMAALIYSSSLCVVDLISAVSTGISQLYDITLLTVMGVRLGTALICSMYLSRIGNATSGLRKSPSHNHLGESMKKDG